MSWEKLAYIKEKPSKIDEVRKNSRENMRALRIENFEIQIMKSLEKSNLKLNNKAYKLTLEKDNSNYHLYLWQLKLKMSFPANKIGEDADLEKYIASIADITVDLLNYTWKIALEWDRTARKITDDGILMFKDTLIKDEDFESIKSFTKAQNKNAIEAIFVLIMQAREIPEKDWAVMNYVCRWEMDKCKKALWEKDA